MRWNKLGKSDDDSFESVVFGEYDRDLKNLFVSLQYFNQSIWEVKTKVMLKKFTLAK